MTATKKFSSTGVKNTTANQLCAIILYAQQKQPRVSMPPDWPCLRQAADS
ncbi:MAG: hypothetical protein WC374_11230 [Phycisphaerae bacterium]